MQDNNIQTLGKALQEAFDANPVEFFDKRVVPLLPRAMVDQGGGTGADEKLKIELIPVKEKNNGTESV